jgi:hypothetical protein
VHVITTRSAVTRALRDAGFVAGLDLTPTSQSIGGMADLTTILLRAFDSHGAEATGDDSQARPN